MQKVSRTAMLKVLDSLANVPKDKPAAVMNALFGKGSLGAFATSTYCAPTSIALRMARRE